MSEVRNCSCKIHQSQTEKKSWWSSFRGLWKNSKRRFFHMSAKPLVVDVNAKKALGQALQEGRSGDVKNILLHNSYMRLDGTYETVLVMALHSGMFCIVDWLADMGIEARTLNEAFIFVAKKGDSKTVEKLLEAGASVATRNRYGCTALHFFAERGDAEMISKLLEHGADPSLVDSEGKTPMHYAVRVCSVESLKVLARAGANLSCVDRHKCTLFHEAMKRQIVISDGDDITIIKHPKREYMEMIRFLINNVPDVSKTIGDLDASGNSCLHHAAQNLFSENLDVFNMLVDAGSSVNVLNSDGMSPLRISIHKQNVPVAHRLIKLGANVDARAPDGSTPLHAAVTIHNIPLVNLLLEYSADVDAKTADGVTPFQIALYWPSKFSILMFPGSVISLMHYGANIFFSAGYRPNPFTHKDVTHLLFEPLNCILPLLIYAIRDQTATPQSKGSDSTFENYSASFYKSCVDDINLMKNERIGSSNFYELLICDVDQFVTYLRNSSVVALLESRYHLTKFPVYGFLIEKRYKRALKRRKLLKCGLEFFNKFFQKEDLPILPEECFYHILSFLKDSHLKQLEAVNRGRRGIMRDNLAESAFSLVLSKLLELHRNALEHVEDLVDRLPMNFGYG